VCVCVCVCTVCMSVCLSDHWVIVIIRSVYHMLIANLQTIGKLFLCE
jgi:hypothetical protein